MKLSIWYRANRVFQEVVFRIAPWAVIFYAKREYGYSLRSLGQTHIRATFGFGS